MLKAVKPLEAYNAVFFDAGDTLLTVTDAPAVIRTMLADEGLHYGEDRVEQALHEAIRIHYDERKEPRFSKCTPENDRAYWIEIYLCMLENLNAQPAGDKTRLLACCDRMYDWFVSPDAYQLFPDVKICLARLSKTGQRMGVVSNFAPTLKRTLDRHGILHYFDPVVVSTEVGVEKPNPEIFRIALKKAGLDGSEVLYIGDHMINDIEASAKAGMDAVRILRYPRHKGEGVASLLDIFSL